MTDRERGRPSGLLRDQDSHFSWREVYAELDVNVQQHEEVSHDIT
jgi:hypothetical protein